MFEVSFVMILLPSLSYGVLHKTNNLNHPPETNYERRQSIRPYSSTISAISNYNKSQTINFQNKLYNIITLKNNNDNQNMIYVTPISVPPPPASNIDEIGQRRNNKIGTGVTSSIEQLNFNQSRHSAIHTRSTSISSTNYNKIKKLLLQHNNRGNSSINSNYVNANGNKNTNFNYDKRTDNNYVIKNDTNLSFSHNYPIIDYNYSADDDTVDDANHKNVVGGILKQQQQHGIYDTINVGGIYDYHPPPNPLLQVLFSRYGRHLPNSYFPSTRNYGFYAYGAGNDINNNLPNGGYKIEMEFDSHK